jgi:hypothetical protein
MKLAALARTHFIGGHGHRIIYGVALREFTDRVFVRVINHQTDHLQPVLIFLLQLNKIGNFHAAWPAPRGPKIQQHHFPASRGQIHGASVDALHRKLRRRVWIPYKSNHSLAVLPLLWRLRLVLSLGLGLQAELLLSEDRAALFISCCPVGIARGSKTEMKRTTPNL